MTGGPDGLLGRFRSDCGYSGVSKDECLSPTNPKGPGCCWNPGDAVRALLTIKTINTMHSLDAVRYSSGVVR